MVRLERRQVDPGKGEIDIAAANGMHPMPAFADRARHRGKGHLLGEHQHQRLEQQGKAGELADQSGSTSATLPSGSLTRGTRTSR
jgi:hypothetical protein